VVMESKSAKILLTGLPGCGKTTAVMKIIANLNPGKVAGFYTQEIREDDTRTRLGEAPSRSRKGFSWTRLPGSAGPAPVFRQEDAGAWPDGDGATGILAHVDIKSPWWVGKYGVDVAGFEESVVPILDTEQTDAELFVIDEIGKMECFSKKFVTAVKNLLASDKSVLATVAKKGKGLISEIKNHPDTQLFNLTTQNRDKTVVEISQTLSFLKKAL